MANRDASPVQFSYEKLRKTADAHLYFGASGAVTLDGPGSKGVLGVAQQANPQLVSPNPLYTISMGVSQQSTNFVDTYVKLLVCDNVPEIEYAGTTAPAASATLGMFRDDISNNTPSFGDVAAVTSSVTDGGAGGSLAASPYRWVVAPVDASGNEVRLSTLIAQEQLYTPTAGHKAVITWAATPGATSYNVYRTLASGVVGSECVFVGNTTALTLTDLGTAGSALYQGGLINTTNGMNGPVGGKLPNYLLPTYNFCRPAMGYGAITVMFLNGTTPTCPAAGEGMRVQIELGDSGAP